MMEPSSKTAPSVMRSSVEMTGITELPSGMRATRENRKMAASRLLKKVRAPAKKKFPATVQQPLASSGDVCYMCLTVLCIFSLAIWQSILACGNDLDILVNWWTVAQAATPSLQNMCNGNFTCQHVRMSTYAASVALLHTP